jgi:hypothetical protein
MTAGSDRRAAARRTLRRVEGCRQPPPRSPRISWLHSRQSDTDRRIGRLQRGRDRAAARLSRLRVRLDGMRCCGALTEEYACTFVGET